MRSINIRLLRHDKMQANNSKAIQLVRKKAGLENKPKPLNRARKQVSSLSVWPLANVAAVKFTGDTRRSVGREFQTTAQETAKLLAPRTFAFVRRRVSGCQRPQIPYVCRPQTRRVRCPQPDTLAPNRSGTSTYTFIMAMTVYMQSSMELA